MARGCGRGAGAGGEECGQCGAAGSQRWCWGMCRRGARMGGRARLMRCWLSELKPSRPTSRPLNFATQLVLAPHPRRKSPPAPSSRSSLWSARTSRRHRPLAAPAKLTHAQSQPAALLLHASRDHHRTRLGKLTGDALFQLANPALREQARPRPTSARWDEHPAQQRVRRATSHPPHPPRTRSRCHRGWRGRPPRAGTTSHPSLARPARR